MPDESVGKILGLLHSLHSGNVVFVLCEQVEFGRHQMAKVSKDLEPQPYNELSIPGLWLMDDRSKCSLNHPCIPRGPGLPSCADSGMAFGGPRRGREACGSPLIRCAAVGVAALCLKEEAEPRCAMGRVQIRCGRCLLTTCIYEAQSGLAPQRPCKSVHGWQRLRRILSHACLGPTLGRPLTLGQEE